jgi:acetolactate synthase-1/2/3 large subunit
LVEYTISEIIVDYLITEGVEYAFGVPGHGCTAFVDVFCDRADKIKPIMMRHEQGAVHAADGYYRASGRPALCFTSIGPGATNLVTGLATAYVDSSAVIALCGCEPQKDVESGVLQAIYRSHESDFENIMRFANKRVWTIHKPERTPDIIARAYKEAVTGRPGPVLIAMPFDIQSKAIDVPELPKPGRRRPMGRSLGDPELVKEAAKLLASAERPAILAGGGVILSGASEELVSVAEILGSPVMTTVMGKGAVPEDHPLFAGYGGWSGTIPGNEVAKNCDVLFAVGARFADLSCSGYEKGVTYNIPPTKLIHLDLDQLEIGKNYPVEIGIVGDAKATLRLLIKDLETIVGMRKYDNLPWVKRMQQLKKDWEESLEKARSSAKSPPTIPRLLKELRSILDRDAIVLGDAGWAQVFLFQQFPVYLPRTHISSGGFSTMGFAVPAAIGAKLAQPEKQVVACPGDGGFLMTLHEVATAVQYNIATVTIVMNNLGWLCIRDLQWVQCAKGRDIATMFNYEDGKPYDIDFEAFAKSFKAYGATIKKPEEIVPTLKDALKSGMAAVINAYVDPETVPPIPGRWELPKPEYLLRKLKT